MNLCKNATSPLMSMLILMRMLHNVIPFISVCGDVSVFPKGLRDEGFMTNDDCNAFLRQKYY